MIPVYFDDAVVKSNEPCPQCKQNMILVVNTLADSTTRASYVCLRCGTKKTADLKLLTKENE